MPQIYRLHFAIYYTVTLGSGKIEEPGTKMLCAPFPTTIFTADILVHALAGFYRPGEERVPTKEHEVITNNKKNGCIKSQKCNCHYDLSAETLLLKNASTGCQ